jgi:hypothetical protein
LRKFKNINYDPEDERDRIRMIYNQKYLVGIIGAEEYKYFIEQDKLFHIRLQAGAPGLASFFGFDHSYKTDTDDDYAKYKTRKNRKFATWDEEIREAHILRLWRTCYNKLWACV